MLIGLSFLVIFMILMGQTCYQIGCASLNDAYVRIIEKLISLQNREILNERIPQSLV